MNIDMIKFIVMGKIILLPLKYILFFLISSGIFLFITTLYHWEQFISLCLGQQNSLLVFLPSAATGIIFPSASAAILFLIFNSRKKSIHPVSSVIIGAAVFAAIFFGFRLVSTMSASNDEIIYQPFNERTIHVTDSSIIYTDECSEGSIKGIIARNRSAALPGFRFYREAEFTDTPSPGLVIDSERRIDITPINPIFNEVTMEEGFLGDYLGDMKFLSQSIRNSAAAGGKDFLLLSIAFTVFLMTSILYRRASVWPLFNFSLILFFHRLIYYLFKLFSEESTFISETFFGGKQDLNMPLIAITSLTAIFLLAGILISITAGRKTE